MQGHFPFQTYAWSLGTTSFRMADFHKKVEEQISIINDFWSDPSYHNLEWDENTQKLYYDFAYIRNFITGDLKGDDKSKSKTARQKTSGLVEIGLIDGDRRLTEVGEKLLQIVKSGNFDSDNQFNIPADSYLYLKQIMKTICQVQEGIVRPFLVTGMVLQECDGYLTDDEFTYLLPLCVSDDITKDIINKIHLLRKNQTTVDRIICDSVLNRYNYPKALEYLVRSNKKENDIVSVGMNRKSPQYDKAYVSLYRSLFQIYIKNENSGLTHLKESFKNIKNKPIGLWKALFFNNHRIPNNINDLRKNDFSSVTNEAEFAMCFFKYMHLFKIRANLSDYQDLNKRYLSITDAFLFDDGKVTFTPLFDSFFKTDAKKIFKDSFSQCNKLTLNCSMEDINSNLGFNSSQLIDVFNKSTNQSISTLDDMFFYLENNRYQRFKHLIDSKFSNDTIISVLESCEKRDDDNNLISKFGGDTDVPTIFEYVVGIAWYRLSQYQGKVLDYMKLSLDSNLLPRTHAGGGESDIVYKYTATNEYPEHSLLIECTLMESSTQRRGEMEPVSRHLMNYLIDNDKNAYCTFISTYLNLTVVSDFRGRKDIPLYRDEVKHVDTMKIIPIDTIDLKNILKKNITYKQLYKVFENAYQNTTFKAPPEWYKKCVKLKIEKL